MTVSQVWLRHLSQTFKSHLVSHVANCSQDAMSVKLAPQTVSDRLESEPALGQGHARPPPPKKKIRTRAAEVRRVLDFFHAPARWTFLETEKEEEGARGRRRNKKETCKAKTGWGGGWRRATAVKRAAALDVIGFSQLGLGEPVRR